LEVSKVKHATVAGDTESTKKGLQEPYQKK